MKNKTWILILAVVLISIGILLELTIGGLFSAGDYSFNYFAAGDYACGVFASGKFAVGIFSIGIFSFGIFSVGIFNIGLYAIGIFVLGWKRKLPKVMKEFLLEYSKAVKTVVVLMVFSFAGLTANAQKKEIAFTGGFGGPFVQLNTNGSNANVSIGGGGAAIFNKSFFLGGFGVGTSDMMDLESNLATYKMKTEYGGPWFGYIIDLGKLNRLIGGMKIGFGEAQLVNDQLQQLYFDGFSVFSPEITYSKRLNGVMGIDLSVYYNYFTGVDFQSHDSEDFNNFGVSLMFKFGGGYF